MTHKVFVYGSLKRGFGNSHLLQTAKFLCKTTTFYPEYKMKSFGGFPAVGSGKHYISGELYEVDDATLQSLDWLESNGDFYQREEVPLVNHKGNAPIIAWMYMLIDELPNSDAGVRFDEQWNIQEWVG